MADSEFNRIMSKIQDVQDDFTALTKRADKGFIFVQHVSYEELDNIASRLNMLEREVFDYYDISTEHYKMMERDIMLLREEVTCARTSKDHVSNR